MSQQLPAEWIDRIFAKLTLVYGRDFIDRWEGLDINDVKADWAHELGGFLFLPKGIEYALGALPRKAPTVLEFRDLARAAFVLREEAQRIEHQLPPERLTAHLATAKVLLTQLREKRPRTDGRDWARHLVARAVRGDHIRPLPLRMARTALGIEKERT